MATSNTWCLPLPLPFGAAAPAAKGWLGTAAYLLVSDHCADVILTACTAGDHSPKHLCFRRLQPRRRRGTSDLRTRRLT